MKARATFKRNSMEHNYLIENLLSNKKPINLKHQKEHDWFSFFF